MKLEVEGIVYSLPLFNNSNLTTKEQNTLLKNITITKYKKDNFILKRGTMPLGLICMLDGKAKIFQDGLHGRQQIIRLAGKGGYIGYRALFANQNYNCSALALDDSICCTISKEPLLSIMKKNATLTFELLRLLALELGISNIRTLHLTQKHLRGRLAEGLIFLIETYGYQPDNQTINIALMRDDIASLCNMTTSNAIRILSEFYDEKIVHLERKMIKILDYQKLQLISQTG